MTEPIKIEIELETGEAQSEGEQLSRLFDDLEGGLSDLAQGAQRFTREQQANVAQTREMVGRFQELGGRVAQLAQALGAPGAASLVSNLTNATASAAALGSTLGPGGAVVGGVLGFSAAMAQLIESQRSAASEFNSWVDSMVGRQRDIDTIIRSARDLAEATSRQSRIQAGLGSVEEQYAAANQAGEQVGRVAAARIEAERRQAALRRQADGVPVASAGGMLEEARAMQGRIDQLRAEEERLRSESRRLGQLARQAEEEERQIQEDLVTTQRDADLEAEAERARAARQRSAEQRGSPEKDKASRVDAREQDEYNRMLAETAELYAQAAEEARAVAEAELAIETAAEERWEREQEIIEERKDLEADELERITERNEAMKDLYREQVESYQEVTGVVIGGITDTLTAIISGQKSAEEAFRSLLASFLSYIAEKAGLKAAEEAAEAIGAYARYDYASGAQHTAAALAWGGLAIAAGVGAAVAAPPPPPAKDSPVGGAGTRADRGERSGGGEVIINWNSPVVTAQTTAELGRSLRNTIGVAETRFGR